MHLKRKRSSPELCSSPSSSSSGFSSPSGIGGTVDRFSRAFGKMPATGFLSPGRTFKRHRNNRPSEEQVYQHTLELLYSAQLPSSSHDTQHIPPGIPSHEDEIFMPSQQSTGQQQQQQQQSLHRFWSIPSAPVSSPSVASSPGFCPQSSMPVPPCSCEDCGAGPSSNCGDPGVYLDTMATGISACGACGKHICFSCSKNKGRAWGMGRWWNVHLLDC
ncbi:hypothetical protein E4U16_001358 [Claviceps sp. LM84 group G4]|nr:hypothetical protein E4U33_006391 [Claviceps sp. LM78 group G4]KAG6078969.1 hypothetical protein E4U16_001358 [Claviceps sp. LM84 group G4]